MERQPRMHRRVVLLGTLLLVLLVLVLSAALLGLRRIEHDERQLVDREVPATVLLLNLDRDSYQAQRSLELAVSTAVHTERPAHLDFVRENLAQTIERWERFAALNDPVPDEVAVRAEYESLATQWRDHVESLLTQQRASSSTSQAGQAVLLAETQSDFERMRHQIDVLEESFYEPRIVASTSRIAGTRARTVFSLLALLPAGLLGAGAVTYGLARSTKEQELVEIERERKSAREAKRSEIDRRMTVALEMAEDEEQARNVITLILTAEVGHAPAELLIADSSHAHLTQVSVNADTPAPGCGVATPQDCPAVRRGTPQLFTDGSSYHACPHLRARPEPVSASCTPVAVGGRSVGVLHVTGPVGLPPDDDTRSTVERLADRAGNRITMMRAFARSETQATTDPLTGLLNRRSFENTMREIAAKETSMVLAMADLDHFKRLNDTHGHETGDRALRLFARVCHEGLRSDDLIARWGGEEFVLAFPGATVDAIEQLLNRVRELLSRAIAGGSVPTFTCSFGLTASESGWSLDELIAEADQALYQAKASGRDQVMLSGSTHMSDEPSIEMP